MSGTNPEWLDWICQTADRDELVRHYDGWAQTYDDDVADEWSHIPAVAAGLLGRLVGERRSPILDAGAGTGLAGDGLAAAGFRNVTAIDLSPGMLERAAARGVYVETRAGAIADPSVLRPNDTFAGIIATGIFADGHCGPNDLTYVAEHLHPGGVLVFTARSAPLPELQAALERLAGRVLEALTLKVYDGQTIQVIAWQAAGGTPRWVPIEERQDRCDIPPGAWRPLTERFEDVRWKGVSLDKSPFELALLPQLIFEQQIETVIELGTGTGGAALWYADQLALCNRCGPVITVDHDPSLRDPRAAHHPGVRFITGNCLHIADVLPAALLAELPHPWLVIEDAHADLTGVLDHLDRNGLRRGDYVFIEDTNLDVCDAWQDWPDSGCLKRVIQKLPDLRAWLAGRGHRYRVDTWYQDLYGYNASKTWNAVLRVMDECRSASA